MFLNYLNEDSKQMFLKLCLCAAKANDVIEREEEDMMHAYCREMNIKEEIPKDDIEPNELIAEISGNTNKSEKKILVLELLGLMYSDGNYDKSEHSFMDNIVKGFNMNKEDLEKLDIMLNSYYKVYKEMVSEIF